MSDFPTTTSRKYFFLRIIGTLLSVALLVYLLSLQGWREIAEAIQQIPTWRFFLAICLMFISRFCVIARWYTLLRSAGIDIRYSQTARITFAGLFSSNFLPSTIGGDAIRLIGVIQLKYDAAISAASLIIDRFVGLCGMAMAVPLSLPSLLAANIVPNPALLTSFLISLTAIDECWQRVWRKSAQILQRLYRAGGVWFKQPVSLVKALSWTFIHMLCFFSILQLLLSGMGEGIPIWQVAGLYSLVYLITLMPISINGYGVQEISMTLVYSNFAGASMNSSLTTALLFRTLMMLASLPGALFVPDILATRAPAKKISADENLPSPTISQDESK